MKRLILIGVLAVAAALPGAAPGAGCSPLSCAPSGTAIGNGLLAARPTGQTGPIQIVDLKSGTVKWRLPAGVFAGRVLVEQSQSNVVTWHDAVTNQVTGTARVKTSGTLRLVGVSQDGARAILQGGTKQQTTFAVVSVSAETSFTVPTASWEFDALTGDTVYLIRYLQSGYEVRTYDLAAGELAAKPLKDPNGSSTIWGIPWVRTSSHDGRYLFTLYIGSDGGAMVHVLDLKTSKARCVDLPGSGDFNSGTTWAMELSPNGKTLWAVSPGYGRVAGIDVAMARVRVAFRFKRSTLYDNGPASSVSAISPDGSRIAVGVAGKIFYVSMGQRVVVNGLPRVAVALGYAPDGTTLWVVGKGEQVTALPAL